MMIPLDWKLRVPPIHFGLLMALSQQAKKGVTVLGGVIDSDYQREIGQLRKLDNYSTMGVRKRVFGI